MQHIGHKTCLASVNSSTCSATKFKHDDVTYQRDKNGKWRRQTADRHYNNNLNKLRQKAIHELGFNLDDIYPLDLESLKALCDA
jgi:hypothetical protein